MTLFFVISRKLLMENPDVDMADVDENLTEEDRLQKTK